MMAQPVAQLTYHVIGKRERTLTDGTVQREITLQTSAQPKPGYGPEYFTASLESAEEYDRFALHQFVVIGLTPLAMPGSNGEAVQPDKEQVMTLRVDVDTSAADAKMNEFGNGLEKLQSQAKGHHL